MSKAKFLYSSNSKDWMVGVNAIIDAVTATLGPYGNNIGIERPMDTPFFTKDGAMVAKEFYLDEPFANYGARVAGNAAQKTAVDAGDGTTTTMAILGGITKSFELSVNRYGVDRTRLYYRVSDILQKSLDLLQKYKRPLDNEEELRHVVSISLNGDDTLTDLVVDAMSRDKLVVLEEGYGNTSYVEEVQGYYFDRGTYPIFYNNREQSELSVKDSYIFAFKGPLSNPNCIEPMLRTASITGKPIILLGDAKGILVKTLLQNAGNLASAIIPSPYFSWKNDEFYADIEALTGAKCVDFTQIDMDDSNTQQFDISYAGKISSLVSKNNTTIILPPDGDEELNARLEARIAYYEGKMASAESTCDEDFYAKLMAYLSGGITRIKVAGQTEIEQRDNKLRVEDAVSAARMASTTGLLPGCGVALAKIGYAIECMDKEFLGEEIIALLSDDVGKAAKDVVISALENPFKLLVSHTGEGNKINQRLSDVYKEDFWTTYDYKYVPPRMGDGLKLGIIDPVGVIEASVKNALSVGQIVKISGVHISKFNESEY